MRLRNNDNQTTQWQVLLSK